MKSLTPNWQEHKHTEYHHYKIHFNRNVNSASDDTILSGPTYDNFNKIKIWRYDDTRG